MSYRKTRKANLRAQYPVLLQVGMVLALILTLAAFRADFEVAPLELEPEPQRLIDLVDIQQTVQKEDPPPPRPLVPVAVPDETVLDDVDLEFEALVDLEVALIPPHPPVAEQERESEPEIFVIVEQMPELIGGLTDLQRNVRYPEIAKRAGVQGRVIVQFVVTETGHVEDAVVVRGIGAGCDEESLRAVKQAQFRPGMQRGKAVKVKMTLPITFRLR